MPVICLQGLLYSQIAQFLVENERLLVVAASTMIMSISHTALRPVLPVFAKVSILRYLGQSMPQLMQIQHSLPQHASAGPRDSITLDALMHASGHAGNMRHIAYCFQRLFSCRKS